MYEANFNSDSACSIHNPSLPTCVSSNAHCSIFVLHVVKHPRRVLTIAILIVALCALLAAWKLNISSDQNKLFDPNVKFFRDYLEIHRAVSGERSDLRADRADRSGAFAAGRAMDGNCRCHRRRGCRTMPQYVKSVDAQVPLDQLGPQGLLFDDPDEREAEFRRRQAVHSIGETLGGNPSSCLAHANRAISQHAEWTFTGQKRRRGTFRGIGKRGLGICDAARQKLERDHRASRRAAEHRLDTARSCVAGRHRSIAAWVLLSAAMRAIQSHHLMLVRVYERHRIRLAHRDLRNHRSDPRRRERRRQGLSRIRRRGHRPARAGSRRDAHHRHRFAPRRDRRWHRRVHRPGADAALDLAGAWPARSLWAWGSGGHLDGRRSRSAN